VSESSKIVSRTGGVVRKLQSVSDVTLVRSPESPSSTSDPSKAVFKEKIEIEWGAVSDPDFYAYEVYLGSVKDDLNLATTITSKDQLTFKKSFPYTPLELFAKVVYVDKNGNKSN